MTKETYKEDLLPEVIERSLKENKQVATDVLFDFYNRYPQIYLLENMKLVSR